MLPIGSAVINMSLYINPLCLGHKRCVAMHIHEWTLLHAFGSHESLVYVICPHCSAHCRCKHTCSPSCLQVGQPNLPLYCIMLVRDAFAGKSARVYRSLALQVISSPLTVTFTPLERGSICINTGVSSRWVHEYIHDQRKLISC